MPRVVAVADDASTSVDPPRMGSRCGGHLLDSSMAGCHRNTCGFVHRWRSCCASWTMDEVRT
jgi:hypothetical protein